MDDRKDSKYLLLIFLTEPTVRRLLQNWTITGVLGLFGDEDEDDELNSSGSARNGKRGAGGVGNSANGLGGARGFSSETITIISFKSFGRGISDEMNDDDEGQLVDEGDFNAAAGHDPFGNGFKIVAVRSNRSRHAQC
jgi:hypothetical protein